MRRNPNQGLFAGYWLDANGKKIRRLRRDEYPEAYRLWRKHAAVRLGIRPIGQKADPWD